MKHIFVLNPAAGKSKAERDVLPDIIEAAKAKGIDYSIHRTGNVGEATSFVKRTCEQNTGEQFRFYAIGGDGTINEVAYGLLGEPNAELAVIPAGSGNDFVRNFGEAKNFYYWDAQFNGTVHPVDLIRINGRVCVNMINIGFDSHTAATQMTVKATTPFRGTASYVAAIAKVFLKNPCVDMKVTLDDGRVFDGEFTAFSIANGVFCGGGFQAAPKAYVDDGLMDVMMIRRLTRLRFASIVGKYHNGTHVDNPKYTEVVEYAKTRSMTIDIRSATPTCIDGEIIEDKELQIDCLPKAIRFVVPSNCGFTPYAG
jgi:YegS/Rv2252/BmrU family lipid kinase